MRRAGLGFREAMSSQWQRAVLLADKRPRADIIAEEAARLAPPEVLAGVHGAALRQALDDRITVRETVNKLSPEDRKYAVPRGQPPCIPLPTTGG